MKLPRFVTVAVCGTGLGSLGVIHAQQQPQPVPVRPGVQVQVPGAAVQVGGQAGQHAPGRVTEHALATCVAIDNQEEVDIAKFAEGKAQSKEVKEFARMIAADHQAFLQKLKRFAPEATQDGYLAQTVITTSPRGRSGESVPTEAPRNTVNGKTQPQGEVLNQPGREVRQQVANPNAAVEPEHHGGFLQLHREIAHECLAESKEAMSKKDRARFDEFFIGHQIARHEAMKVKLVVFQRHATGELNQILAEGQEATENHLARAEQIMKNLMESSADIKTTSTSNK